MRGQVRLARPHPADVHALGADLAQYRERASDVRDACALDLLLAEPVRRDEGQQEAPMLDEDVVELSDEQPGQLLLVGFLGNNGLPRLSESVDEVGKGQY